MKNIYKYFFIVTIILLGIILLGFFDNISNAEETEINNDKLIVKTQYIYNKEDNTVIGKMISNNPLKDTKVSWKLSKDKKEYTTILKSNGSYTTTVEDIYGNIVEVLIDVKLVDDKGPEIEIEYIYNKKDNTVTGIMHSNEELKDTKVSWKLSEDKKEYTTILKSNGSYTTTVEDIWGNKTEVLIDVKLVDEKGPEITMEYKYNPADNTVTGIMHSNEELKDTKVSWELSEDKKEYITILKSNGSYTTTVEDIWGNKTEVLIDVRLVDEKGPEITMEYIYNEEYNTVTGIMHSNEELKDTKVSWELSENKKEYTTILKSNGSYTTTVEDIWGNKTEVLISVTGIDEEAPIIKLEYTYNVESDTITVTMHSNEIMADTKPTWTLSEDKLSYSKTFSEDIEYSTNVLDVWGNEAWIKITIKTSKYTYPNSKGPNITMKYIYDDYIVTAYMISDIELKDTKTTWTLSKDKKVYTKQFTENQSYQTNAIGINGNEVKVSIIINLFKDTTKGIDVSEYQKLINWTSVKQSGIDFAIIRAGYRGWGTSGRLMTDMFFEKNIQEATKVGMNIGVYFFTQAINVPEAIEEANYVISLLSKYNVPIRYPIAIDTERTPVGTGRADNISKELRTEIIKAFCDTIKNAGYKPMIYASKNWLLDDLNISQLMSYDVWLAHYTDQTDYQYPYAIWQYTSSGLVNGIVGRVDMNIGYKKY